MAHIAAALLMAVDTPFLHVVSGGWTLIRPPFRVSRFALLRCVLILAICLDGGVGVWRATAMASEMAVHAASDVQRSDSALAASDTRECENEGLDVSKSGTAKAHDGCSCANSGCSCACAFTGIAFVHTVPFAAQHTLAAKPSVTLRTQTVREFSTAVFRPPIG